MSPFLEDLPPSMGERVVTLAGFLLARLAEDEAEVVRWQAAMEADEVAARGVPAWVVMAGGLKVPARVLAEVEAKRRIVRERNDEGDLHVILQHLASVYSDHPDFDPAWRI